MILVIIPYTLQGGNFSHTQKTVYIRWEFYDKGKIANTKCTLPTIDTIFFLKLKIPEKIYEKHSHILNFSEKNL